MFPVEQQSNLGFAGGNLAEGFVYLLFTTSRMFGSNYLTHHMQAIILLI